MPAPDKLEHFRYICLLKQKSMVEAISSMDDKTPRMGCNVNICHSRIVGPAGLAGVLNEIISIKVLPYVMQAINLLLLIDSSDLVRYYSMI